MTIWRMCNACWIPKTTNTQTVYIILIYFPLQQRLHERPTMLRYVQLVSLFFLGTAGTYNHVTDRCGNQDVHVACSSLYVGYNLLHLNYYL